ncbi:MAG: hypothetical protein PHQ23_17515 [Candidatus Wallbacteria bacterium]|nr:hypothetical protein [Candidatus Wallbacteria bacterium]
MTFKPAVLFILLIFCSLSCSAGADQAAPVPQIIEPLNTGSAEIAISDSLETAIKTLENSKNGRKISQIVTENELYGRPGMGQEK